MLNGSSAYIGRKVMRTSESATASARSRKVVAAVLDEWSPPKYRTMNDRMFPTRPKTDSVPPMSECRMKSNCEHECDVTLSVTLKSHISGIMANDLCCSRLQTQYYNHKLQSSSY